MKSRACIGHLFCAGSEHSVWYEEVRKPNHCIITELILAFYPVLTPSTESDDVKIEYCSVYVCKHGEKHSSCSKFVNELVLLIYVKWSIWSVKDLLYFHFLYNI